MEQFTKLQADALIEVKATLATLAKLGMLNGGEAEVVMNRIAVVPASESKGVLPQTGLLFEGVPEIVELKREVLAAASRAVGPDVIIASTTSTILADDLSSAIENPRRFLNAHWLNPAYLIPLVEISPGAATDPLVVSEMKALFESIGKVPVVCAATPGVIVPRIQALAMNEAARMVGEGVASAEEIDQAIRYGFGFRYAVLGLLEFIDWGGGDILYYASRYMAGAMNDKRFEAPKIVHDNMAEGRNGLRDGKGFFDYTAMDVPAYRRERLAAFMKALKDAGLARPPV